MKSKVVVGVALAALAFAGIAQAAGLFANREDARNALTARERTVAKGLTVDRANRATTSRTRRGRRGRRGPRGKHGPAGPKGSVSAMASVSSPSVFLCGWKAGACSTGSATAVCPPGTIVTGGGFAGAGIRAFASGPVPGGWRVGAANESASSTTFKAIAVCAS